MVSNVGRQPNSNVWVFSPSLQIDHRGQIIPPEEQLFYWWVFVVYYSLIIVSSPDLYTCRHASAVAKTPMTPVPISLPLRLDPLSQLFEMTRECLGINYIPSLLAFTGGMISFHYESILDLQDECPLFLCYSYNSGTGEPCILSQFQFILCIICIIGWNRQVVLSTQHFECLWCGWSKCLWARHQSCCCYHEICKHHSSSGYVNWAIDAP